MGRPLLSVITVVLNPVSNGRTETFRQMVNSVAQLSQLCPVEHIIQDGGSTDGSLELYREYGTSLKVICEPDHGIYDAMNKAAAAATGTYLSFLNSDDYYNHPQALVDLLHLLEKHQAAYGIAPVEESRASGKITLCKTKMYSIFGRMPYCHQALVVRRDVFQKHGGYDPQFRIVGDHDFALRLYLSGEPFVTVHHPFAFFRYGGLSHDKKKNHEERMRIFRKNYGSLYTTTEEQWLEIASNKRFPWRLFRQLLTYARPQDRMRMRWWYFLKYIL